jgi:hypothetical protein
VSISPPSSSTASAPSQVLGLPHTWVGLVLYLVAIGFLATYSINRERHATNLEKLARNLVSENEREPLSVHPLGHP